MMLQDGGDPPADLATVLADELNAAFAVAAAACLLLAVVAMSVPASSLARREQVDFGT